MSLTSNCPKCQKQIMVPDGLGADTQVRCPLCQAEYPLSDALALAPPALIVVGMVAALPAEEAKPITADTAEPQVAELAEPSELAEAAEPPEPEAEAMALPGAPGEPAAHEIAGPWHDAWSEVKEPQAGDDSEPIAFAREEGAEEEDLDGVDFAAITGKTPPSEGGQAVAPPPRKRRRKREANIFVRIIGMLIAGGLALPVVYALAVWTGGAKNDKFHIFDRWTGAQEEAAVKKAATKTPKQEAAPGKNEIAKPNVEIPANGAAAGMIEPAAKQAAPDAKPEPPLEASPEPKPAGKPGAKPQAAMDEKDDDSDLDKKPNPKAESVLPPADSKNDIFAPAEVKFQPVAPPKVAGGPKTEPKADDTPAPPAKPEPKPEAKPAPDVPAAPKVEAKTEVDDKPPATPEAKPPATPAKVAPPAAAPADNTAPNKSPSYPAEELLRALKEVDAVFDKPSTPITDPIYEKLCQVAERVTFAQGGADQQKEAVRAVVQRLAAAPQGPETIVRLARKRIDAKVPGGILAAGTVTAVREKNGLHGTVIKPDPSSDAVVMVMSKQALDAKEGDRAIVFGSTIVEPQKNLPGYTGSQPLVIWAGLSVKMP